MTRKNGHAIILFIETVFYSFFPDLSWRVYEMLKVCGLTKQYGSGYALRDVSFEASAGEIVGLVGHNGCGKSTTMNIITGYIAPTAGSVWIDGTDVTADPLLAREKIGYLPETPPLYPDLTVNEQLRFAAGLRGIRDRETAISDACGKADVSAVRGRLIRNLSKGYRQRVGLAQAFLGNPPVIILDEPSNGLDPQQIAEMREIIRSEKKKKLILLSSHVLSEVELLCDRLVILSSGTVSACGTLEELRRQCAVPDTVELTAEGVSDAEALRRSVETLGCKVREVREASPSLESVFLRLTRDERYRKEADR